MAATSSHQWRAVGKRLLRLGFLAVAGAELLHWSAARRHFPGPARAGLGGPNDNAGRDEAASTGLIVLGCPPRRNGTIHPMALWRVEMAKRAYDSLSPEVVIFCGGAKYGLPSEASLMAEAASRLGIPGEAIRVEEASTNTWENIAFSLPFVQSCHRVAIVSDPLHAARARRLLSLQRPDVAARLVSAAEYAPLERWWLKLLTAVYELPKLIKPDLAAPSRSDQFVPLDELARNPAKLNSP